MTRASWRKERNAALQGDLCDCNFCDFTPKTYMDLVEHREKEHGIKPGWSDVYGAKEPVYPKKPEKRKKR